MYKHISNMNQKTQRHTHIRQHIHIYSNTHIQNNKQHINITHTHIIYKSTNTQAQTQYNTLFNIKTHTDTHTHVFAIKNKDTVTDILKVLFIITGIDADETTGHNKYYHSCWFYFNAYYEHIFKNCLKSLVLLLDSMWNLLNNLIKNKFVEKRRKK